MATYKISNILSMERFRVEEKILKLFEEAAQAVLDCGKTKRIAYLPDGPGADSLL